MRTKKNVHVIKRFFPAVLGAALLLSSCSNDELTVTNNDTATPGAVDFRVQDGTNPLMRASTTTKEYINSFVISAIRNDDTWDNPDVKYVMKAVTVHRAEGSNWTYSPEAFFPTAKETDNTYTEFHAYSPANAVGLTKWLKDASDADDSQIIQYEVPVPDVDGKTKQEDLLVAYEKVYREGYNKAVTLQFRHALSRVLVKAYSTVETPVTITGLTLKNLYYKGTLNLKGTDIPGEEGASAIPSSICNWVYAGAAWDMVTLWNCNEDKKDFPYVLPEQGVSVPVVSQTDVDAAKTPEEIAALGKLITTGEQGMFVLPQTTAGDGGGVWSEDEFGLEVSYRAGSKTGTATLCFAGIFSYHSNHLDESIAFEIGRQYVLNLAFTSNGEFGSDIDMGAKVTFGDIDLDDYDNGGDILPEEPHEVATTSGDLTTLVIDNNYTPPVTVNLWQATKNDNQVIKDFLAAIPTNTKLFDSSNDFLHVFKDEDHSFKIVAKNEEGTAYLTFRYGYAYHGFPPVIGEYTYNTSAEELIVTTALPDNVAIDGTQVFSAHDDCSADYIQTFLKAITLDYEITGWK